MLDLACSVVFPGRELNRLSAVLDAVVFERNVPRRASVELRAADLDVELELALRKVFGGMRRLRGRKVRTVIARDGQRGRRRA